MERLTKRRSDGHADPAKFTQFIGQEMDDKLADYEDAEEQGRLIKLPFSLGQKIYEAFVCPNGRKEIFEWIVDGYEYENDGLCIITTDHDVCIDCEIIGEKIFGTREEAEAKLKEMEDNNG